MKSKEERIMPIAILVTLALWLLIILIKQYIYE